VGLLQTPCVVTLAALRQAIGWRWTAFGVAYGLLVAYLPA
jgi:Fe2+ transport system protein B